MSDTIVKIEIDQRGVACITLNRPEVHNAFNPEMIDVLHGILRDVAQDDSIRVVLLTGAGKSFSAGADLNWMRQSADYDRDRNISDAGKLSALLEALATLAKPTIALVRGAAIAGGTGLVACCDIALAEQSAKFGVSEVRIGLIPATISPYVIDKIGAPQARRYFLTGERFGAEEAQKIGLVHEVVADEDALNAMSERLIDEILKGAPKAIAEAKQVIAAVAGTNNSPEMRATLTAKLADIRARPEAIEGVSSFLEKRPPSWSK
ncbi:MAG: enoyl-CoA hydratase/isomerase family protein [Rhodospirillaceae bacterium]|nr:enoyl-CoA hydratase/isomerase family protein [Rhodospirillales bacterium]MBT3907501.1 enoyl-CoA hydratase/isomerase family protein [Rhodospirillaceae bacterium]MBT4699754.1 enoyl-CoA hydratase/isomerase family protein [Rhodospirillaceae bacterium]MBT5035566.1 enoyl-CoA hydratase/isomerase family protein [Rhodospirillaceae bacterium]MBT6219101.1 enoyl-CoA hydratase/isomerase family protein [Rhodospirillaceae bacterium]